MTRNFIYLMLILSAFRPAFGITVAEILSNAVQPEVACAVDPNLELKNRCIARLCPDSSDNLPPLVKDVEKYVQDHPYEVAAKARRNFEEVVRLRIRKLNGMLDELEEKIQKDTLNSSLDVSQKDTFIRILYSTSCIPVVSRDKSFALHCADEQLEKSPAKNVVINGTLELMKNNWDVAILSGFLTYEEVPTLMTPVWKASMQRKIGGLKKEDPESHAFLLKGISAYETLNHLDRIRFVKLLSTHQYVQPKISSEDTRHLTALLSSIVTGDRLKSQVKALRIKINSAEFMKTTLASMEVQNLLEAFGPTTQELQTWKVVEAETKNKIFNFYSERTKAGKMSPDSLTHYKKELDAIGVDYHSEKFDTRKLTPLNYIMGISSVTDTLNIVTSQSSLLLSTFMGASLGTPVMLVSDYYVGASGRPLDDDNFGKAEIKASIYSIKNPEHGKQWLAHELGHHFSQLHSDGLLSAHTGRGVKKSKECIVSRYDAFKKLTSKDAGSLYLEEEFADEFAFSVDSDSDPLLTCPVLLNLHGDPLVSLEIMKEIDNHNPFLWRALNQFKNSPKPLPAECERLIENESYKYRNCIE